MICHPCEPILASSLWQAYKEKHDIKDIRSLVTTETPRTGLLSGCTSVDQVISPGLTYGEESSICCISSEPTGGGRELLFSLLITHLLASHTNTATIIDGLGLDLVALSLTLGARLAADAPQARPVRGDDRPNASDASDVADAILSRLAIARVFSYEGLVEAVSEFVQGPDDVVVAAEGGRPGGTVPRGTVPDSQADEEEEDLFATMARDANHGAAEAETEMVGAETDAKMATAETETTTTTTTTAETEMRTTAETEMKTTAETEMMAAETDQAAQGPKKRLLLIHDLPSIFGPIQRQSSFPAASALLASFLNSLGHACASSHSPCAIVMLNGLTGPPFSLYPKGEVRGDVSRGGRPRSGSGPGMASVGHDATAEMMTAEMITRAAEMTRPDAGPGGGLARSKQTPAGPSVFRSASSRRVAFGHVLDRVGLSLMVHRLPKRAGDAAVVAHGGTAQDGDGMGTGTDLKRGTRGGHDATSSCPEWVSCVEVLGDRDGGRRERFGFFQADGRGVLRDAFR